MGEMQSWYVLIRAAKFLGVPPWELAKQPIAWQNLAIATENIDAAVESEMRKKR